jgi:hypothetical protein
MKPNWEMVGDVGAYHYSKGEQDGYQQGLDNSMSSLGSVIGTAIVGALCVVGLAAVSSWISGGSAEELS